MDTNPETRLGLFHTIQISRAYRIFTLIFLGCFWVAVTGVSGISLSRGWKMKLERMFVAVRVLVDRADLSSAKMCILASASVGASATKSNWWISPAIILPWFCYDGSLLTSVHCFLNPCRWHHSSHPIPSKHAAHCEKQLGFKHSAIWTLFFFSFFSSPYKKTSHKPFILSHLVSTLAGLPPVKWNMPVSTKLTKKIKQVCLSPWAGAMLTATEHFIPLLSFIGQLQFCMPRDGFLQRGLPSEAPWDPPCWSGPSTSKLIFLGSDCSPSWYPSDVLCLRADPFWLERLAHVRCSHLPRHVKLHGPSGVSAVTVPMSLHSDSFLPHVSIRSMKPCTWF